TYVEPFHVGQNDQWPSARPRGAQTLSTLGLRVCDCNPILYSALRLREELAKVDKVYPNHLPYVLVGHSMGGMLTHAQVTTVTRAMWERDKNIGTFAKGVFASNSSDSLIVRAMTYRANPRIHRVVFICTPHRGSNMASGGIGRFGISLITLPLQL